MKKIEDLSKSEKIGTTRKRKVIITAVVAAVALVAIARAPAFIQEAVS